MTDRLGIGELLEHWAAERPDAPALEDARSDRLLTWRDLRDAAAAWSGALEAAGAPVGSSVLLTVADPVALAAVLTAVLASGRRAVAADPALGDEALAAVAARAGGAAAQVRDGEGAVVAALSRIRADGRPADAAVPGAFSDGGGSLLFTSGSSGVPKGVDLSAEQLLAVARQVVANERRTPDDRGLNPLPLVHVNAQVVGLVSTLVSGGALVLDARFHRTGFWDLVAERRITWVNAVPAMLAVLAKDRVPETGLRYVRSASAPLPPPVRAAFAAVPFVVSWGMTEAASQITATPPERRADGDVGLPLGTEVQVRGEDGGRLEPGERGELWIRGPGVVRRYVGGVAADRFDADGWLQTGDVGAVGADGRVTVAGRGDDVINRGGELVDPSEIEAVLVADPRVREAAAAGRPDDVLGQVPVAAVQPVDPSVDAAALVADLTARAAAALPAFKRPVEIRVVAELPRSAAGKVARARLLESL